MTLKLVIGIALFILVCIIGFFVSSIQIQETKYNKIFYNIQDQIDEIWKYIRRDNKNESKKF